MKAQIPWLRVFVEGVVIVGSILLAFGIDAWWQEWKERQAEGAALQQLVVEFAENRDRLDQSVAPRVATASNAVYEKIMAMPRGAESLTVADTLLQLLGAAPTFDRVTPVLDGLVRSGRLEIIEDLQVRNGIAAWERWLAQLTETEMDSRSFLETQLKPALATRGDMARVFAGGLLEDRGGVDWDNAIDADIDAPATVEQKTRVHVLDGERIAVTSVSGPELTLEVGAPASVGHVGHGIGSTGVPTPGSLASHGHEIVATQNVVDRGARGQEELGSVLVEVPADLLRPVVGVSTSDPENGLDDFRRRRPRAVLGSTRPVPQSFGDRAFSSGPTTRSRSYG